MWVAWGFLPVTLLSPHCHPMAGHTQGKTAAVGLTVTELQLISRGCCSKRCPTQANQWLGRDRPAWPRKHRDPRLLSSEERGRPWAAGTPVGQAKAGLVSLRSWHYGLLLHFLFSVFSPVLPMTRLNRKKKKHSQCLLKTPDYKNKTRQDKAKQNEYCDSVAPGWDPKEIGTSNTEPEPPRTTGKVPEGRPETSWRKGALPGHTRSRLPAPPRVPMGHGPPG